MESISGDTDMSRAHDALVRALRIIDEACRDLGITYWVDGGTLLGTVRHRGPIPWDDDVDLAMLRHDLERFVEHAPPLLGSEYSLRTPKDDSAMGVPAKIYLNGTHVRIKYSHAHGLPATKHDGLFVDVEIVDRVSKIGFIRRMDRALAWLVNTHSWARHMAKSPNTESSMVRLRWSFASHAPKALIAASQRWLDWCSERRDGHLLAIGRAGLWNGWPYPRDVIFPLTEGTFAGLRVPVPADSHSYLIGLYGSDYMTLPPPDQRITHTDEILFDD